jgi:hypothetical protein
VRHVYSHKEKQHKGGSKYASVVLSDDQLEILGAIRPGRGALGTGMSEEELKAQFPDRLHDLRQLAADGYVGVVTVSLEETGPPSPDQRVYHRTDKGEKALRDSSD